MFWILGEQLISCWILEWESDRTQNNVLFYYVLCEFITTIVCKLLEAILGSGTCQ